MASNLFGGLSGLGGSTLGEVLVKVGVDTKQLNAGLAKAEVDAKAAGKSVGTFGALAKAGFAVAAVAVTAFVASSIKSYEEHQRVVAQLRLQINGTTTALETQATALQNLTGYQDEEVLSADTVLARFKLTQSEIQATVPLVLDFARAMGTDVTTSAQQVGKALLGNTRALKAIGIEYTKTGNKAVDLAAIQAALAAKVGGASAAFGKTFAGQVQILAAQFDDLKEKVGKAVIPLLVQLIPVAQGVVQGFSDLIDIIKNLGTQFPVLGTALRATFVPLQLLLGALHEAAQLLGGVQIQSAKLVGGLGPLKAMVKDTGLQFRNFGGLVGDALQKFRQDTISKFQGFAGAVGDLGKRWTITADQAVHSMQRMAQMQRTLANDLQQLDKAKIGTELKKFLLEQGPQAIHAFIEGTKKQRNDFQAAFDLYKESAKRTTDGIKQVTSTGGVAAGKALSQGLAVGIRGSASVAVNAAVTVGFDVVAALKAALQIHSPSAVMFGIGKDMMAGLALGIDAGAVQVQTALQKMVDDLRSKLQQLISNRKSFTSGIAGGFSGFGLASPIDSALSQFGQDQAAFLAAQTAGTLSPGQVAPVAPDVGSIISGQLQQAQQLARLLRRGGKAGLGKNLLSQFAGEGASGIAGLQAILGDPALLAQAKAASKAIAQVTNETANRLGDKFFGKSIDSAREKLDKFADALQRLTQAINQNSNLSGPAFEAAVAQAVYQAQRRRRSA